MSARTRDGIQPDRRDVGMCLQPLRRGDDDGDRHPQQRIGQVAAVRYPGSFGSYIGALAGWNPPELSDSSSARMTWTTALISAKWVNACGKLPRCRPVRGSISSA